MISDKEWTRRLERAANVLEFKDCALVVVLAVDHTGRIRQLVSAETQELAETVRKEMLEFQVRIGAEVVGANPIRKVYRQQ